MRNTALGAQRVRSRTEGRSLYSSAGELAKMETIKGQASRQPHNGAERAKLATNP